MTTLVISPHLDDAVLSLGGSIAAWVAAGERVVVASVYTRGPPLAELAPEMRPFADYATRLAEDVAACAVVGAEPRALGCVECAFRKPYLPSFGFFTTPPDRDPEVTRAIAVLEPADRIAVPLGIGNHVDHVEALLAALAWQPADRLVFYEDFYALASPLRARHPVARLRSWCHDASPLAGSPRLAAAMRRIASVSRGPDAIALAGLDGTWTVERSPIDERAKLAAIACYGSQTRAFGGLLGIVRALRAYHAWWGGAEPLWRVRCTPVPA